MSPDGPTARWRTINDLFHRALEQPPDQRDAFLDSMCGGDAELRDEVATLVASYERAGAFLQQPAAGSTALRLALGRAVSAPPTPPLAS